MIDCLFPLEFWVLPRLLLPRQRVKVFLLITARSITTAWEESSRSLQASKNEMSLWVSQLFYIQDSQWTRFVFLQTQLVHLIHYMGGSIRKEMSSKATHLICTNAYGDKYRYAQTFKLKAVRSSWVMDAWRNRDESAFSAQNEDFTNLHLLKIFEGCRVSFIGFSESDKKYMVEQLRSHNGIETANDDETCTHKVSEKRRVSVIWNNVTNSTMSITSIIQNVPSHFANSSY